MSDISPGVSEMVATAIREAHSHIERMRGRRPWKQALPAIARRIGVTPRRIAAILHGEARNIYAAEMDSLRAAVLDQIHSEIRQLEAELVTARLTAARPDATEIRAAEAALEAAKAAMKGAK